MGGNWTSTEDCFYLIDDGEDQGDEQIEELNYQVELLREIKEQFHSLEEEIEKKLLNMMEIKNVESADGDTL